MVLVLSFWIKVSMKRSALSTKESLKRIWNKASLIFFSILFIVGTLFGVKDTYLVPYLTDDLGASSQLISNLISSCWHLLLHYLWTVINRYHALYWFNNYTVGESHGKASYIIHWGIEHHIHWDPDRVLQTCAMVSHKVNILK